MAWARADGEQCHSSTSRPGLLILACAAAVSLMLLPAAAMLTFASSRLRCR